MPLPARFPFRPSMHLRRRKDFERVYREGNRARGALMTVAVVPNGTETTRLGLSIGKRVWKGAVRRNRVRRVFREAFRLSYPELPPGLDVVLIGSAPRIEPRLDETRAELVRLTAKAYARWRERASGTPAAEGGA